MPRILRQGVEDGSIWAEFESKVPVLKAELCFTKDTGKWQKRVWDVLPGKIEGRRASGALPEGTRAAYLNLVDEKGLVVSTEHLERL